MLKRAKNSVVFRITAMLISVMLMAFVSIFSSMYMSDLSEYDGEAINLSGSMRMMSYRITSQMAVRADNPNAYNVQHTKELIQEFDDLVKSSVFKKDFVQFDDRDLEAEYLVVLQQWEEQVKPVLNHAPIDVDIEQLQPLIYDFVNNIDFLVTGYQALLERRLATLRSVQMVTLFATLLLMCLAIYSIHNHIAQPLNELTAVARSSVNGDLTQRSKVSSSDELGLLSLTLNAANDRIAAMYGQLEQRVAKKTKELKQNNALLELLYTVANQINDLDAGQLDYESIINKASDISGVENLDLCLATTEADHPFLHILTDSEREEPSVCVRKQCVECFKGGTIEDTNLAHRQQRFPIVFKEQNYGVIVATTALHEPLSKRQAELLAALAAQLGTAMSIASQTDQQRRIALQDERAIIARELHDSLAQALSYLKIQVARIEKSLRDSEHVAPGIEEPVKELKEGLASAYRQLRELLTTFRLQIDDDGLEQALQSTINKVNERNAMQVSLDYQCKNVPFSPTEEIHLLQIAKEALQNALNHSQGSEVHITLRQSDDGKVHLSVSDNGIGIDAKNARLNHYGTVIMRERAQSLDGQLSIENNQDKGACVYFCYTPKYAA